MAGFGVLAAPIDLLLARIERKSITAAGEPRLPIVLVCGPPRSGTTVVAQYLISTLRVGYLNNLTALLPRSPITANLLFGRHLKTQKAEFKSFYGKTRGLAGPNDALYIWDRWLGPDRSATPEQLDTASRSAMAQFFGALQTQQQLPTLNKVNRLNTCAHLVAMALPTAKIVYMHRNPVMLAQSLYVARRDIVGDFSIPYGVAHSDPNPRDPVDDVCRQVEFYERQTRLQSEAIGPDRCIVVEYERFCADPTWITARLLEKCPELQIREGLDTQPARFAVSKHRTVDSRVFERLSQRLTGLIPDESEAIR